MRSQVRFVQLTEKNFKDEVLTNPEPVLVEVRAEWSGTCQIMAPIIEKLAWEFSGYIKVGKLDIETNREVLRQYGLDELPSYLFFNNGELVDRIVGAVSKKILTLRLKNLINIKKNRRIL